MRLSGCVYRYPAATAAAGDLTREQLAAMRLVGTPVRMAHYEDRVVGRVVDEFTGRGGSKHVSIDITVPDTHPDAINIANQEPNTRELSLMHHVRTLEPLDVSICARGARPGCTICHGVEPEVYRMAAQEETQAPAPEAPEISLDEVKDEREAFARIVDMVPPEKQDEIGKLVMAYRKTAEDANDDRDKALSELAQAVQERDDLRTRVSAVEEHQKGFISNMMRDMRQLIATELQNGNIQEGALETLQDGFSKDPSLAQAGNQLIMACSSVMRSKRALEDDSEVVVRRSALDMFDNHVRQSGPLRKRARGARSAGSAAYARSTEQTSGAHNMTIVIPEGL